MYYGKEKEIMESLIGHTSGFAVPTYVIDAPGGGGKIPVMPTYLISWSTNKVVLRNYEEIKAVGVEKLLCDFDDTVSLIPEHTDRMERRIDKKDNE